MRLIFLTGHRKSGTTMLHKLFDGHSQLCVYPVDVSLLYAYFPAFAADPGLGESDLLERARTVVARSLVQAENAASGLDGAAFAERFVSRLKGEDLRSKKAILSTLLACWQEMSGCDASLPVVIKETSQSIHVDEYLSAFPDSKFVNLVRDPRDNYAALKAGVAGHYARLGEGDLETLASLINRARMDFLSGYLNAGRLPDRFCVLRFEDLVAAPQTRMRELSQFCGIAYEETMLRPTIMSRSFAGNSYDNLAFDSVSAVNVGRWRERISEEEAMVIEFWLGDVMERAGYECVFSPEQGQAAFARFYDWYNSRYFFRDAFAASR